MKDHSSIEIKGDMKFNEPLINIQTSLNSQEWMFRIVLNKMA